MSIRVLVVDDQPLVRAGLGVILGAQADIEVVGEAGTGSKRSTPPAGWSPTSS